MSKGKKERQIPLPKHLTEHCLLRVPHLRNLVVPGKLACVYVLGYHEPGDGGGGHFWFDAKEAADDNGGTIIRPNSISLKSSGRFKRLLNDQHWLSVKWFGAKGDGKTPDTAAIQAAIDAVPSAGVVYFPPPSRQYLAENLQLKSNLVLLGDCSGKNDLTTKGLKGQGCNPVLKTGSYPINDAEVKTAIKKNRNIMIAGLFVENHDHPCMDLSYATNFTVRDCILWTRADNALTARFSYRGLIDNCFIATGGAGSDIEKSFALTLFDNCNAVTVSNCTITGGQAGSGVDIARSHRTSIKHCTFELVGGWGIRFGGKEGKIAGNCHAFEATNNYFEQVRQPISVGAHSLCSGGSIDNNFCNNKQVSGKTGPGYGIRLGRCLGVAVRNNSFFGNGTDAFINFSYREVKGVRFFLDGTIEQNHTENFSSDYDFDPTFAKIEFSADLFGQSRISFMQKSQTGVSRSYITDTYAANQTVPPTSVIAASTEGGRMDIIEVVDAVGKVDATLFVGSDSGVSDLVNGKDLATLTFSDGMADVGFVENEGRIQRGKPVRIHIVPGQGTGIFRLKFTYRN